MNAPASVRGSWTLRHGARRGPSRRPTTARSARSFHSLNAPARGLAAFVGFAALSHALAAESTGAASPALAPEIGVSVLRVFGALAFVLALFLGGVWLFRNWQRLAVRHSAPPRLRVLETKPLGQRQALHLVGYRQQRFLLAASPAGVSLLTALPDEDADESDAAAETAFAATLEQSLVNGLPGKLSQWLSQPFGATPIASSDPTGCRPARETQTEEGEPRHSKPALAA